MFYFILNYFIVQCREYLGINKKGNKSKGALLAIRDHIKGTGNSASLHNFCIIDKTNNELDLLIHGTLLILRDHPILNLQSSSIPFWFLVLAVYPYLSIY